MLILHSHCSIILCFFRAPFLLQRRSLLSSFFYCYYSKILYFLYSPLSLQWHFLFSSLSVLNPVIFYTFSLQHHSLSFLRSPFAILSYDHLCFNSLFAVLNSKHLHFHYSLSILLGDFFFRNLAHMNVE